MSRALGRGEASARRAAIGYLRELWRSGRLQLLVATFVPILVFFTVVWVIPIGYAFGMSFFQTPVEEPVFVGLANYLGWLEQPIFHTAVRNSVVYALSTTVLTLLVGMGFALAVNQGITFGGAFRTLMIFTYLFPVIVGVFMWKFILDPNLGVLNQLLVGYGVIDQPIAFFGNVDWAFPSIVVVSVWKWSAFAFFIVLARLQAIDPDLYERSRVMGATTWQAFRDITLPNLRSAILIVLLVRSIWMFNKFDVIWLSTKGGPLTATTTLPILIYERAFFDIKLGEAMALAGIMFLMLAAAAVVYFRVFNPSQEVAS